MVTFVQAGGSRLYVPNGYASRVGDARVAYVPHAGFSPGATVDPEIHLYNGTLLLFPTLGGQVANFAQSAPAQVDAAEAALAGVRIVMFRSNGGMREGSEILRTDAQGQILTAPLLRVGATADINSSEWSSEIPAGALVVARNGQLLIDLTPIADPAGLYLDPNMSVLAEMPVGNARRIVIDLDGPARGSLRFPLSLDDALLTQLGVGPRYFAAERIPLDEPLRPDHLPYPLYALEEGATRVFNAELDFAAPYETEPAAGGSAARPRGLLLPPSEPLRTHLHAVHGHEVELTPAADGAGFALTASPLEITATAGDAILRSSTHYFAPHGAFRVSMRGGNPALARLTMGLSNLETMDVTPQSGDAGSQLLFVRAQPAFSLQSERKPEQYEKEAFASLSALHGTCHTSWLQIAGVESEAPTRPLSLQPEGMQGYRRNGSATAFSFDAQRYSRPKEAFPFVPLLGLKPASDDAARAKARQRLLFERDIIAKVRRRQVTTGIAADFAATASLAADDVRSAARTPQGYAAERGSTNGPWTRLTFTASSRRPVPKEGGGLEYPGLTAVGVAAKSDKSLELMSDALSHNRLLLVSTWGKLDALGFDLTVFNTLHIAGWATNIKPQPAPPLVPPDTIVILKYDDRPLRLLAADINRWTRPADFAPGALADLQSRLLDLLPSADGDELLRPLVRRIEDPNWNGLLVLDASLPLTGIPAQMRAIAGGLPELLPVPYAGVDISGIEPNQPPDRPWRSAIFGLIRYDKPNADWQNHLETGVSMRVPKLIVRVENDAIERFECKIELKLRQLFDVPSEAPDDVLTLEGRYESRIADGRRQDTYSFAARDVYKKTFSDSSVIKHVEIRQLKLITTATDAAETQGRFLIDGQIKFNAIADVDLLSIDGIDFTDFAIDMSFGLKPLSFSFNYPNLQFDFESFNRGIGRRPGASFLSKLPFKLRGFRIGNFKLPSLGYIGLGGLNLGGAFQLSNEFKYGFDFDLDLGSLGALAKKLERFKLLLAIGWKPELPSGGGLRNLFAAGFKLDLGEGAGGIDLGIEGVLRITAERFNLKKEGDVIILSADDCHLEVLGKRLPSEDSQRFSLFLFANLGGASVFDRPGWYASFHDSKPEPPIAIQNVVLAQRVDVRLGEVSSTRGALTWLGNQERFEGADAAKKFVNFASASGVVHYDPNREWFIALRGDFFRVFRLGLLLKDPDLYGAYVGLMRDEDPDHAFMSFDLLYQKMADGLGRYSVEVTLPPELRTFEVGAASVTIGLVRIDIYTDGGFLVDLGFPQEVDYSRSFVVQAGVFIGKGGMYVGRVPAITVPSVPAGYDQVFRAGFAMRIGLGREFQKGPIRAGLSVSVFGRVEGFLAARTRSLPTAPDPYWLRVQGEIGIIAEIEGCVDLRLIRARLLIRLWIATGIVLETRLPVLLYCEAGVSVSIEFEIGSFRIFGHTIRITITLSYSTTLRFEWTLPARVPALPFGDTFNDLDRIAAAADVPASTWIVPELNQLGLVVQPMDLRLGLDVTRAMRDSQPLAVLVPTVMWLQHDPRNMAGDLPLPPFAQLAKGLIAWAALQCVPGAINAQQIGVFKGAPTGTAGMVEVRRIEEVLRGFDAVPFDQLDLFLGRLLAGSALSLVSETQSEAYVFPIPPGLSLRLTPTDSPAQEIDYALLGMISDAESDALLQHVDRQFAELDQRRRPTGDALAADATMHPLVSRIFRNWCEALALTALEVAQSLWEVPTGQAGVSSTLGGLLQRIDAKRWGEIAARAGQILLGGIRVPDRGGFSPLLQRAGLMLELPLSTPSQLEMVGIGGSTWLTPGAGRLNIDGPRLAGLATANMPLDAKLERPPSARLVPKVFILPPFARLRPPEGGGTIALLCPLGEDLRAQLGGTAIDELTFAARQQSGAAGQFKTDDAMLHRARPSMVFELAVQRIALADGDDGKRINVRSAFQIAGTSEAQRGPLDALFARTPEEVTAILAGSEVRLAWHDASPSDDPHPLYLSPQLADPAHALVARATVSIERRPFSAEAMAEGAPILPESIFRATFEPTSRFGLLYLLQRAAIVNSGGTYLILPNEIARLLEQLAESGAQQAGENGRLRVSIVVTFAAAAPVPPSGAVNALLFDGADMATLDSAVAGDQRVVVGKLAQLPDLRTTSDAKASLVESIPLRPAGTELVRLWRKRAARPGDGTQPPTATELGAHLAARFGMLEFAVSASAPDAALLAFDESLPISPEHAEPAAWNRDLLASLGPRPDGFGPDDLRYDLLLAVGQLAATSSHAASADGAPYAAIGRSLQLGLGWRDMYGNRLGSQARTVSLQPRYTDPLVPVTAWPGVRARVFAGAAGSRQLKLELTAEAKAFADPPGSDGRLAVLRELQRVIDQLSDPRVRLFVETPLGGDAPAVPRTLLDEFLKPLRAALHAGAPRPAAWSTAWTITPDTSKGFLEIGLSLVVERPATLVGSALPEEMSRPIPGVGSVRSPLPLTPQDPAFAGTIGEARAIANEFRAAFAFQEGGVQRRYWVARGTPGPGGSPWWAVDDRLIPLPSGAPATALAPPPLARALMSATNLEAFVIKRLAPDDTGYLQNLFTLAEQEKRQITAIDRDADALLASFLDRIENFLSPTNAPVTALATPDPGAKTPFERIAAAKAELLDLAGNAPPLLTGLDTVLQVPVDAAVRVAALAELRDACAIRLQRFYEIGSVVVKPLGSRVEPGWIQDTGAQAPKLYGQLRFAAQSGQPLGFRAETRGIPLAAGQMHIAIGVVPERREEVVDLAAGSAIAYEITHVERLVESTGSSSRLAPSRWLNIVPLSDAANTAGRLPSVQLAVTGETLLAPLPLRRVPQLPQLDRPTANLYNDDPPPQTYAQYIELARRWTYGFDVAAEFRNVDEVCGRLIYNQPPGMLQIPVETPAAPRIPGLFEALVAHEEEVAPYWSVIATEAARRAGVPGPVPPHPELRFTNACNRYAEAVERVVQAFSAVRADAAILAAAEDRFVLRNVEQGDGQHVTQHTLIAFVDHLATPAAPWPVLAGEGKPWLRIRRIRQNGDRQVATPPSIGGSHGGLGSNPISGEFTFTGVDDTMNVRRREVQIGRLDALRQQSVWVAASVRRNDQLGGLPANPLFVYRTAEVYLQEVMVPHLKRRRTIEFLPPAMPLKQALLQALVPVFAGIGDRPQPLQVRLDYESGRIVELLEATFGEVQDEPGEAFLPEPDPKVMVAGIAVVEAGTAALRLQDVADALERGLREAIAAEPIGRHGNHERGRVVLNVTVRTADEGNVAQPLLQLERLVVDLRMIADL